jgi:hypothetical protein
MASFVYRPAQCNASAHPCCISVPDVQRKSLSQVEHLLQDLERVIRIVDRMTNRSWVLINFVVIAALECLVAKEMDLVECDPVW